MKIKVNGTLTEIEPSSILEYLKAEKFDLDSVVVEVNKNIVNSAEWAQFQIRENDNLELLSFVGGG